MLYQLLDWLFCGDLVSYFVDLREFLFVLPVGCWVPYTVVRRGPAVLAANEFDDGLRTGLAGVSHHPLLMIYIER